MRPGLPVEIVFRLSGNGVDLAALELAVPLGGAESGAEDEVVAAGHVRIAGCSGCGIAGQGIDGLQCAVEADRQRRRIRGAEVGAPSVDRGVPQIVDILGSIAAWCRPGARGAGGLPFANGTRGRAAVYDGVIVGRRAWGLVALREDHPAASAKAQSERRHVLVRRDILSAG